MNARLEENEDSRSDLPYSNYVVFDLFSGRSFIWNIVLSFQEWDGMAKPNLQVSQIILKP